MVWTTPSFNPSDQYHLYELLAQARRPAPDGWLPVHLGSRPLGLISSERAMVLSSWLPLVKYRWGWEWQADHLTARARSEQLRWAACALRDAGMISGWRNEAYASWGPVGVPGDVNTQELFRLERAAFGYFGFRSHAVHVNGFTQDGRVWRAKRAWTVDASCAMALAWCAPRL